MLTLRREKDKISIIIDTGLGWSVPYSNTCHDELYAMLLYNKINEQLGNTIAAIREKAYLDGWKDKTQRKPKKTWFSRTFSKHD